MKTPTVLRPVQSQRCGQGSATISRYLLPAMSSF